MQQNQKIRTQIKNSRLMMWEVAQKIGIADSTFSKWLRTTLSDDKCKRVEDAIKELTKPKE